MNSSSLGARASRAYRAFTGATRGFAAAPTSSFPFVSGDTFRQLAGWVFSQDQIVHRVGLNDGLCFASGPIATNEDFVDRAQEFVADSTVGRLKLIIHNGDHIPTENTLLALKDIFSQVYCVNVIKETAWLRALPIGLENASLDNNGRLSYYLEGLETPRSIDRSRLVVSSFHTSNHPALREPTAELFRKSRFGFDGHSWKRAEYREVLKDTLFVVSPPGNGPDCHRTWESIYMGAIPVVLKGHLAKSLWQEMPILAVDRYEDFLGFSDTALREAYSKLSRRPASRAFSAYWVRLLS